MKSWNLFKLGWLVLFFFATSLQAEEATQKHPKLEEMSAEEFRAALKKSHSEISSRLGDSAPNSSLSDKNSKEKNASLSEKRNYETSAENRISLLSYKIRSLELEGNKNWGYSQSDAAKLRSLQSEAREQLRKIKSDNTAGWKTNKQILDSLLRQASQYQ